MIRKSSCKVKILVSIVLHMGKASIKTGKPIRKKIVVLGSTGSLGVQTLELLKKYRKYFEVVGLSANKNLKLLKKQAGKFKVKDIILTAKDGSKKISKLISLGDVVVNVISGVGGIGPTEFALKAGKILLLGNKESLVADGQKTINLAKHNQIIPIDSEHNAIYEILKKYPNLKVEKIILPCSGGPFANKTQKQLMSVTANQALNHPKWKMGKKISLESATLINKGLEIIEAHYLFGLPLRKILVVLHPQCLIHGMVKFKEKTIGYFGRNDMREHIENALAHVANLPPIKRNIHTLNSAKFKFDKISKLKLPGIEVVLNAFRRNHRSLKKFLIKEEKVLEKFLANKISFLDIFKALK